jgi:hypothetical protein
MLFRYCIRTCPQREALTKELYDKLRAHLPKDVEIDIVNDTIGREPIRIFMQYLQKLLAENPAFDYLVTLEDDAIFNDYLHQNLTSFEQLSVIQNVGCVQLSLASKFEITSPYTLYSHNDECYFRTADLHYSCGLIFSKALLQQLDVTGWESRGGLSFDVDLTKECHRLGFKHLIHFPALVATKPQTTSTFGHEYAPEDDLFFQKWNRSDKDHVYKHVQSLEKIYGFQKKIGDMDNNPLERTQYYLKYLHQDVLDQIHKPKST